MVRPRRRQSERTYPDALCLEIVARQHGVISREQALDAGLSPDAIYRRLKTKRFEKVLPRVFRAAGSPTTRHQEAMAASLWAGPGAVVSRQAAAVLLELEGVTAGKIDVTIDRHMNAPAPWIVVHHGEVPPRDVRRVVNIPVSCVERTLFDLSPAVDEEVLEATLESALRKGLTSPARVARFLHEKPRGVQALRRLIEERGAGRPAESLLETKLLRLLRNSGLPLPVRQHEVRVEGTLVARIDFAYPQALLAIECDGYRYHSGRAAWRRDTTRANALSSLGWRLIRVTWDDIQEDPTGVVDRIEASLSSQPRISRLT